MQDVVNLKSIEVDFVWRYDNCKYSRNVILRMVCTEWGWKVWKDPQLCWKCKIVFQYDETKSWFGLCKKVLIWFVLIVSEMIVDTLESWKSFLGWVIDCLSAICMSCFGVCTRKRGFNILWENSVKRVVIYQWWS